MPLIIYVDASGERHEIEVAAGYSVMQGAVDNGVQGIVAECGGCCSCATCHVYVDEQWAERVGQADTFEQELLEGAAQPRANSRLSCQIEVTDALDGLLVYLPKSQY
jgi:2Fe-2S ferredoxin